MFCSLELALTFSVYQGGTMKTLSSYLDSHFKENFIIHEVDLKLIPEQNSKIRAKLESLEQRAPVSSSINLKFTNEEKEIFGELTINGAGKEFYSGVRGKNPLKIYNLLEKEVDNQLIQWKKTRFRNYHTSPSIIERKEQLIGGSAL